METRAHELGADDVVLHEEDIVYDARSPLRPSSSNARGACLEVPLLDGSAARYRRLRFASVDEYSPDVAHAVRGMNGVSRLFRGRGVPSLAHLRFT